MDSRQLANLLLGDLRQAGIVVTKDGEPAIEEAHAAIVERLSHFTNDATVRTLDRALGAIGSASQALDDIREQVREAKELQIRDVR
jgi:hypothetical protein